MTTLRVPMRFDHSFLKRFLRRKLSPKAITALPDEIIERHLSLTICKETAEETGAAAVFASGRKLARQEDWEDLAALIMVHDRARDMTPDGTPLAELLSAGARSDLILSLQNAARRGILSDRHETVLGLEGFCAIIDDPGLGYGGAILLAETLMDAGWAWYEQGASMGCPERHLPEFQALFQRATDALAPYSAIEENAPALAATHCGLLAGRADAASRVVDEYEDLIDLNPMAPGHLRALGLHLLPQWFANFPVLETQARRLAAQTSDVWGHGGYTWIWLDALALDPTGFAYLDMDYFLDGVDDILSRRPSQHYVNLLVAYLTRYVDGGADGPDRGQRRLLARRRASIVRARMQELHPWVWGNGPFVSALGRHKSGRDNSQPFVEGRRRANAAMADIYARELSDLIQDAPLLS